MNEKLDFDAMAQRLLHSGRRRRVAVAAPEDAHTEEVIDRCMREGIADFVLFARREKAETAERIAGTCPGHAVTVTADTPEDTARMAVKAVREGQADVLMKGTLNTDVLLRAVLDKENGLLIQGRTLSHITATQIPQYGKLLLFADAAVIPHPDTEQFDAILRYALNIFRKLNGHGCTPRVALIHCTEKTNAKFAHTLSYAELRRRAAKGRYGRMLIDGPMDVKTACDSESARIKGLTSDVTGNADILIFPNIEAANTFYKTITLFAGATTAGMLCGAVAPVVIASRADSAEAKMCSMLMACSLA